MASTLPQYKRRFSGQYLRQAQHGFFRANRQCLLNLDAVAGYRPYENQKLQVLLKASFNALELIVSKEKAGLFRQWLDG